MIVPISCRIWTIYSCSISEIGKKQIITLNQNRAQHQTQDQERSAAVNKQASSVTTPHGTSVSMQTSFLWMICYTFKLTHQPERVWCKMTSLHSEAEGEIHEDVWSMMVYANPPVCGWGWPHGSFSSEGIRVPSMSLVNRGGWKVPQGSFLLSISKPRSQRNFSFSKSSIYLLIAGKILWPRFFSPELTVYTKAFHKSYFNVKWYGPEVLLVGEMWSSGPRSLTEWSSHWEMSWWKPSETEIFPWSQKQNIKTLI